ncbi:hypothetical protein ElyMa_003031300 [Elysia marginata]|uniref:Uncharacterized protein n=1 Tax=Elysia marginata TaxID=1093978 RepID=A0AAV4IHP3_9GAST|nr:hypothetical protein ElyMa_003031300 [Elysia marginata]
MTAMMTLCALALTLAMIAVNERHLVEGKAFTWSPATGRGDDFALRSRDDALQNAEQILALGRGVSTNSATLTVSNMFFMNLAQGEDPVDLWNRASGSLLNLGLFTRNGSYVVLGRAQKIRSAILNNDDNLDVSIDRHLQFCESAVADMKRVAFTAQRALENLLSARADQEREIKGTLRQVAIIQGLIQDLIAAFQRLIQNVGL